MDYNSIKSMEILQRQIMHHSKKQSVLNENIANADTPGYSRKDMKAPDFSDLVKNAKSSVNMSTTHPGHINPTSKFGGPVISTGDQVKLDQEAIEIMKNSTSFAEATQTYKKFLSLFRDAIGGGQ